MQHSPVPRHAAWAIQLFSDYLSHLVLVQICLSFSSLTRSPLVSLLMLTAKCEYRETFQGS